MFIWQYPKRGLEVVGALALWGTAERGVSLGLIPKASGRHVSRLSETVTSAAERRRNVRPGGAGYSDPQARG